MATPPNSTADLISLWQGQPQPHSTPKSSKSELSTPKTTADLIGLWSQAQPTTAQPTTPPPVPGMGALGPPPPVAAPKVNVQPQGGLGMRAYGIANQFAEQAQTGLPQTLTGKSLAQRTEEANQNQVITIPNPSGAPYILPPGTWGHDFVSKMREKGAGLADFMMSPLGVTSLIGPAAAGGKALISRLVSGAYAVQMVPSAIEKTAKAIKNPTGDNVADAIGDALMAGPLAAHTVMPEGATATGEPPTKSEAVKEAVGEAAAPPPDTLRREQVEVGKLKQEDAQAKILARKEELARQKTQAPAVTAAPPGEAPVEPPKESVPVTPKKGGPPSAQQVAQPEQREVIQPSSAEAPAPKTEAGATAPTADLKPGQVWNLNGGLYSVTGIEADDSGKPIVKYDFTGPKGNKNPNQKIPHAAFTSMMSKGKLQGAAEGTAAPPAAAEPPVKAEAAKPVAKPPAATTFYRGTVPGSTERIKEPFEAAKGKTFVARKPESARNYGSEIEEVKAKPGAKILYEGTPEFGKIWGHKKYDPELDFTNQTKKGENQTGVVNEMVRKAQSAGYDLISFKRDSDIGSIILNEDAFIRGRKPTEPPAAKAEPIKPPLKPKPAPKPAESVSRQTPPAAAAKAAEPPAPKIDPEELPAMKRLRAAGQAISDTELTQLQLPKAKVILAKLKQVGEAALAEADKQADPNAAAELRRVAAETDKRADAIRNRAKVLEQEQAAKAAPKATPAPPTTQNAPSNEAKKQEVAAPPPEAKPAQPIEPPAAKAAEATKPAQIIPENIPPVPAVDTAAIKRTTPALKTPERDKLEADYEARKQESEALWEQVGDLEKQRNAAKPYSKKREALESKIEKLKDKRGKIDAEYEPLRKQSYQAELEDAASQTENEIARITAERKIEEMRLQDETKAGKFNNEESLKFQRGWKAAHQAIVDELRKKAPEVDSREDKYESLKKQLASLSPEENARAIEDALDRLARDFIDHPLLATDDIGKRLEGFLYGSRNRVIAEKVKTYGEAKLNEIEARYMKAAGNAPPKSWEFADARRKVEEAPSIEAADKALENITALTDGLIEQKRLQEKTAKRETRDFSKSFRPLSGMRSPAITETDAWKGNVTEGDLAFDGKSVIDTSAIKDKSRAEGVKAPSKVQFERYPKENAAKSWGNIKKAATTSLEEIGHAEQKGIDYAVYAMPDGSAIVLSAKQVRLIKSLTGFDEARGSGIDKPVVFYKKGNAVAATMPYINAATVDLDVARKAAKGANTPPPPGAETASAEPPAAAEAAEPPQAAAVPESASRQTAPPPGAPAPKTPPGGEKPTLGGNVLERLVDAGRESDKWLRENGIIGGGSLSANRALDPQAVYHLTRSIAGDVARGVISLQDAAAKTLKTLREKFEIGALSARDIEGKIQEHIDKASALSQITEKIGNKQISPASPYLSRTKANVRESWRPLGENVAKAWEATRAAPKRLWEAYEKLAPWTSFKDTVGRYDGQLQFGSWEMKKFRDTIRTAIPDKLRREAITNYVQANGDMSVLEQRAKSSSSAHRPGYNTALTLNPAEIEIAKNVRIYFDQKLDEAHNAGMLKDGVENYVNQIWDRDPDNPAAKNLIAAAAFHELQPNPAFLKKRIFESYFEGEQAGYRPRDKDIGALIAAYDQSFNTAVASRAFIRNLHDGVASDGRPIVEIAGTGRKAEPTPGEVQIYIKPKVRPENTIDYKPVDHPALRGWKWASSDEKGNPIFVQGDFLVHPEYAQKLKNILGHSAVRNYAVGRAALALSNGFKQTLLTLSPFHQVQIGVHALEHTVSPVNVPKLDLNNPTQRALVNHGLMVAEFRGMDEFAEGVSGTGLLKLVPVLGQKMEEYQDYLFREYIPRIKMSMAQEALERNRGRYAGKLSEDQILALTANQANAAFGHLSYKLLARNPTFQDVFRLLALAPDFLEARSRFVAQAAKPYGREQLRALALGAAAMTAGKFVIGQVAGEKQDWSLNHLFYVRLGGREYGLRTIQGDLAHMLSDPRSFISNRLNPAVTKPVMEGITGRDQFGRRRSAIKQFQDYFKTAVPIPFKGLLPDQPQDLISTFLQSTGVQSRQYTSKAQQVIKDYYGDNPLYEPTERTKAAKQIVDAARSGDMAKAQKIGEQAIKAGVLQEKDVGHAIEKGRKGPLAAGVKYVPWTTAIKVYEAATDEERQQIGEVVAKKLENAYKKDPASFTPEVWKKLTELGFIGAESPTSEQRTAPPPGAERM